MKVICELGVNHGGDFSKAREMVYAAMEAGADFAKGQFYNPDLLIKQRGLKGREAKDLAKWAFDLDQHHELWQLAYHDSFRYFLSVFDVDSLHKLPFELRQYIKIPECRSEDNNLLGWAHRYAVNDCLISVDCRRGSQKGKLWPGYPPWETKVLLATVPEYPARLADYRHLTAEWHGISDHTPGGLGLVHFAKSRQMKYYEIHGRLDDDDDCYERAWSRSISQLREVCEIAHGEETKGD